MEQEEGKGDLESRSGVRKEKIHGEQGWSRKEKIHGEQEWSKEGKDTWRAGVE